MKPDSPSDLSSLFAYVSRCAWNAVRGIIRPALAIQSVMLVLVVGYYLHWPTTWILETLGAWRDQSAVWIPHGDLLFNFVSTGLCAGVFAEICKVYFTQQGRWNRRNLQDAAFKFCIVGMGGLNAGVFYLLQAHFFGSQVTVHSVVLKVLVDQFVFTPFFAAPFPCVINHLLLNGINLKSLGQCFTLTFYVQMVLPLVFTTWCFWFPGVSLIYSLPQLLQFPLFLCACTIWGLIFTSLVNPDAGQTT